MKVSQLLGERYKETPSDCQIDSHAFMMRGGYIKPVCNGIYSLFTPAKRIVRKVENIIREEMDAIGGQEVLLPVAMPATIWRESGRYDSIGSEMLRFKDRAGVDMCLGMTHEEAAVHLARNVAKTYQNYPFMIYQIQTKFRDEPRARGGLIRVREFTMKDAYSFHTSQEDLERYYELAYKAYERIFARVGVPEVVAVKSDSGMMGGKVSHEFMLLTEIGEDTLAICTDCDYRSNMEVADCIVENDLTRPSAPLTLVETPNQKTIEDVAAFLGVTTKEVCKAVVYQRNADDSFVVAFLRGDLDVNETKLRNLIKTEVHPAANLTDESGLITGFIGPVGLDTKKFTVVFDQSVQGVKNLVCGANKPGFHFTGFEMDRDFGPTEYGNIAKTFEGAICPKCGKRSISIQRGIEVGNIFQLGKKYTESMGMTFTDASGASVVPIMGCYGIGVGRLVASVCQVKHDANGPIWPMSIAPWQVQICALRPDDPQVRETADALYDQLQKLGVEVLFDDRSISAGFMFSDADLFGIPVRVVVSPKNLKTGVIEIAKRDKSMVEKVEVANAVEFIRNLVTSMLAGEKR